MYKLLLVCIISFIFLNSNYANNSALEADTLLLKIEKMNISDKEKAEMYMSLAENQKISLPRLSITSLNHALDLYQKMGEEVKAAQANATIADIYTQIGFYVLSAEYYFKAYQAFIKNNNDTCTAWLLVNTGNVFYKLEKYNFAELMYQKAFQYFKKSNYNFGISVIYLNLGLIKEKLYDNDSALYYFDLSLNERIKNNDKYNMANIYYYIARIYIKKNDFENAHLYLSSSLKIISDLSYIMDLHYQLICLDYLLYAQLYEKQQDLPNAFLFADSALHYAQKISDTNNIINSYINIAKLNEKQNITIKAANYYKIALDLSKKTGQIDFQSTLLIRLLNVYIHQGDKKMAVTYFNEYEQLLKAINNNNNQDKYETLMLSLEVFNKKKEIETFRENNELNVFYFRLLIILTIFIIVITRIVYHFKNRLWKSNRELINTAFEGIIVHQEGIIQDANESFFNFSGYSLKDVKKQSLFDFIAFDIKEKVKYNIKENKKVFYQTKIKLKNGLFVDVEAEARPISYFGRKMRLITIKDISEQIKANAQIQLFKTIIEQNYSSIVITDTLGIIEYVNPSFVRLTGYSSDEAIGKNPKILKTNYHDTVFYENLWESITTGNAWNGIFKNINKYGGYFWEEATITPIKDNNGKIIKFAAIKRDITERKQLEEDIELFNEQFKKIFDSIDDFVFVIDFETEKIISANLKAKLSFGDVEQKHLYDVLFNDDKQHFLNIPKDLLLKEELKPLGERGIIKEEVFLKSIDSWYDFNMRTITWINKIKAILIVGNDITERKNKILSLNALNASKDKFFSIISHDLKSPFQGLLGFAELLLNNVDLNDTDMVKMVVRNIYDASKTSYSLIENLLEWANLQRGHTNIDKKKLNLYNVSRQTLDLLHPFSSQKNITINLLIPNTSEVFSDEHILSTVLRNLINNAIKFTPYNGIIIINIEDKIDKVIISVKDNGIGIPKEMISKLFSIETKFSVIGTAGEKGNALGLILCKELIEKNGGEIYVESKLDAGSTFYFTVDKLIADTDNL